MRVLITGGFGYLGGRLAQFLATHAGFEILLGSRQSSDPPSWLPQAKVVQTLWSSATSLAQACVRVDAVAHLAGMNAQECNADPVGALECNAAGTAHLLAAAIQQGVSRFLYVSTAHVYGSPLRGTITEATCPVSLHPYATSHRAGEDIVRAANLREEIDGVVIRLSNSYGAPAHKGANCWMLLANDLCRQAVTARRMPLQSSGLQRRDFVPLHEALRAIHHLMLLPEQEPRRDVFNVGGEWSPTVWEVAGQIQERCKVVLGYEPQLTRVPPRACEDSASLDYRIDALRESGFRPHPDKTAEIDKLLEFCKTSFI